MSRYIERAENIARFIDVVRHLVLDLPDQVTNQWESLIRATDDLATFERGWGVATEANAIRFLTFDRDNPNSIYSCLWTARENARSVRDAISSEMWEQINRSYLMVKDAYADNRVSDDPAAFFSSIKKACHLFVGITDTTMTHGEGWHFSRMGRLMERADKTSRMIDVKYYLLQPRVDYVGSPYDGLQWAALLKSISAFEMYRKRYQQITPTHVAEFLVLDRQFPRSMHYCLIKAEESLHAITGTPMGTFSNLAEQRIGRLGSEMDYVAIREILDDGLHDYLDDFQLKLNEFGEAVYHTFFAITPSLSQQKLVRGNGA
jgi:uncharacterized alpha-E superfamily protein